MKATLEKAYRRRFDDDLEKRAAVWKILVRDFFSRYVRPSDRVLDLGCGYGQFINQVQCTMKYGMDLNPASREMLHDGVIFFEQDCSSPWPLDSSSLDLIFTSNFMEHLPTKLHITRTLEEAFRCLRPGGRLIAMGPNIKYVTGSYWDFFDHHIPLTELSVIEVLELIGFRRLQVNGRFLPYTMVNAPQAPSLLLSFYLGTPWLWRFFGAQFLIIVEKP